MTLAEIVYSIPSLAILIALAGIYLHPSLLQIAILSAALLLIFAISVALGFMLSTFSNDVVQSYAFSRLLSLLFTTLPPVYYPITYVPDVLQVHRLSFAHNIRGGNYAVSNRLPQNLHSTSNF